MNIIPYRSYHLFLQVETFKGESLFVNMQRCILRLLYSARATAILTDMS
jgi:hypothetical protein